MKQAEVFGVAVGGGQQQNTTCALEELTAVGFAIGSGQNIENARDAGASIGLVFGGGVAVVWHRSLLAADASTSGHRWTGGGQSVRRPALSVLQSGRYRTGLLVDQMQPGAHRAIRFSTELRISACMPPNPSGNLKICVVGVLPSGRCQRPACWSSAVVFLARRRWTIRKSASEFLWPGKPGCTVCCSGAAMARHRQGSPMIHCRFAVFRLLAAVAVHPTIAPQCGSG